MFRTLEDEKMIRKGYNYRCVFSTQGIEPLYCKTMKSVIDLHREYPSERFDVIKLSMAHRRNRRIGGVIACSSRDGVDNLIQRLRKLGYNYFTRFLDTRGPAVQYSFSSGSAVHISGW